MYSDYFLLRLIIKDQYVIINTMQQALGGYNYEF